MNKQQLIRKIVSSFGRTDLNHIEKIRELETERDKFKERYTQLRKELVKMLEGMEKEKLEVNDVRYHFTHETDEWDVMITAIPKGRQHQFIADRGYDSQGNGKNRKRLFEKAKQLDDAIKEHTGIRISTNPYSFEKNDSTTYNKGREDSILINFKI